MHAVSGRRPGGPANQPVTALLLAEAVDVRVYVPMRQPLTPRPRPASVSSWTERAAAEETEAAPVANRSGWVG
ncbi:hypothetical protein [Micromonospora deserti]|uniref:hypothetical protein n=1 Tax=Micromonospora deserti TaxID=2070366 RepID=UPI001F23EC46|nr:hypothetical protein [Micromonospora deserti]